jgi:SPW repeat
LIDMMKHLNDTAVGWSAIALGAATAMTPVWAETTPVGVGFTLGAGALAMIYGLWGLLARDPTRDHWALSVVGLVLAISPWVGGFVGDAAAWVAWIAGLALLVIGGAAYVADEDTNVAENVRIKMLAAYLARHPGTADEHQQRISNGKQPVMRGYLDSDAVVI